MLNPRKHLLSVAVGMLLASAYGINAAEPAAKPTIQTAKETASATVEDGGTGAFKAIQVGDSSLATHTIFRPKDLSAFGPDKKLPILTWGNGGCANSPNGHQNFLSELASHGYLVIAIGPYQAPGAGRGGAGGPGAGGAPRGGGAPGGMPGGMGRGGAPANPPSPADPGAPAGPGGRGGMGGMPGGAGGMPGGGAARGGAPRGGAPAGGGGSGTKSSQLLDAVDWAIAQNADKDSIYFGKIDTTKIAAAGMSCGGLQALEVSADPRITTTLVCNSGIVNSGGGGGGGGAMGGMPALGKDHLKKLHGPIIYILGGSSDIAYANGMDDFKQIEKLPAFAANMDTGHGGTYSRPHGGEYAPVALAWINWNLKGDKEAAKMFSGEPCELSKDKNWKVEKKNIS